MTKARWPRWPLPRRLLRRGANGSSHGLRGSFDAPGGDLLLREPGLFEGWALDRDSLASKVELSFNAMTTVEADLGMYRPDVPVNLGEPRVSSSCGWSARVDLARWPEGNLEVSVTVSGRSGRRLGLGTRSFRLAGVDLVAQVAALRDTASAQQRALEGLAADLKGQIDALRTHQNNSTTETLFGMLLSAMRDVRMVAEPPALATTSSFAAIDFNHRVFRALSWQAELRSRAADWPGVLTAARVAAEWASHNHPGVFPDPALDQAVAEAGRHLVQHGANSLWYEP